MQIINAIQSNGLAASAASFTAGLACANYALIIRWLVNSKWVTAAIRKDPKLAEEIVAELQKDVDAVADAPVAAAAAPGPIAHS